MLSTRNFIGLAFVLLNIAREADTMEFPNCDSSLLGNCVSLKMICNEDSKKCICKDTYHYNSRSETIDDLCVDKLPDIDNNNTENSSNTAAILAIFFVALIISGLVLTIRRYNLIHWFRQKIINRRDNNAMYEDVMIGQDDPPIAA